MSAVVKHYYESSWVDISDYVEEIGEVPTILRNRDYTLKAERLSLKIAATIRDVRGVDYEFSEGEQFAIYVDDELKYQGIIESSEYIYRDMTFEIELRHRITGLESVIIDYDTLHSSIIDTSNWSEHTPVDYYTYSVVGLLWALKCIFGAANLSLDTTEIDEEILFTSRIIDESNESYPLIDITYQDLFMYEIHLWNLGQSYATSYTIVDPLDKVNGFNFLSEILSRLPVGIKQHDINAFKFILDAGSYSITDDNKFEYKKTKIKAENEISLFTATYDVPVSFSHYYETDPNNKFPIPRFTIGSGNVPINIMAGLYIYFSNAKTLDDKYESNYFSRRFTPDDGLLHELVEDIIFYELHDLLYNYTLNLVGKYIGSKIHGLIEEEILTNYESDYKTVEEHNIDLEWENSFIKQVSVNE